MLSSLLLAALVGASTPSVPSDSLRPDHEIRQVALRHATEIRNCYESHGLRVNPTLSGTIEVELHVLPTGRVDTATIAGSQLAGSGKQEVEECVLTVVRHWRFERGPFAKEAIIYPFQLTRNDERIQMRSS